jgi:hypothetical protein
VKVHAVPSLLAILVDLVGIGSSSLHFSLLLSLHFNLSLCRPDVSPSAAPSAEVQITKTCCSQRRAVHEGPKAARKGGVGRLTGAARDPLLFGGSAVLRVFGLLSSLEHSCRLALLLLLPALHLPRTAITISRAPPQQSATRNLSPHPCRQASAQTRANAREARAETHPRGLEHILRLLFCAFGRSFSPLCLVHQLALLLVIRRKTQPRETGELVCALALTQCITLTLESALRSAGVKALLPALESRAGLSSSASSLLSSLFSRLSRAPAETPSARASSRPSRAPAAAAPLSAARSAVFVPLAPSTVPCHITTRMSAAARRCEGTIATVRDEIL